MPEFSTLSEGDPAYKILEVCAYRELLLRQTVNDSAVQLFLAYATGTNLDQIGANFGVIRNTITPANLTTFPTIPAVMEADSAFRARILLSLDGMSTAGPTGSYLFWALSVPGVADAFIAGPMTPVPAGHAAIAAGNVIVTCMGGAGDGSLPAGAGGATNAILSAVALQLNAQSIRPLTDCVTVQSVTVVNYAITAAIYVNSGPDSATIVANAQASAVAYAAAQHKVGQPIYLSALYAALLVPGVENAVLQPLIAGQALGDIDTAYFQTAYCTAVNVTLGGVLE